MRTVRTGLVEAENREDAAEQETVRIPAEEEASTPQMHDPKGRFGRPREVYRGRCCAQRLQIFTESRRLFRKIQWAMR